MQRIRVAHVMYDFYRFEPRARRVAEAAAYVGCDVDAICLRKAGEPPIEVHNGVRIYHVRQSRGYDQPLSKTVVGWLWFLVLASITLTRLHLKRRYDVIHVHNMPDFLVFCALIPKLLGAKVILDVQDCSPELLPAKAKGRLARILQRAAAWQEQASARFADHVVTVAWPFEDLLAGRGTPREKISILLNSADPVLFPETRRCPPPADSATPGDPFIFMYMGISAPRAGLDTAVRALAIARRTAPNLRLDLKARGEHVRVIRALAEELGVADAVVFTDECPVDEIVNFIVHGDVAIVPYRCDGFTELLLPTKAYEFAWMRRPMIASETVGMRSMFRPESVAFCPPDDPEAFAAAMLDLYQHPEKRAALVANAAEDYEPYRWEVMRERYRELLVKLSKKRGVPAGAARTARGAARESVATPAGTDGGR